MHLERTVADQAATDRVQRGVADNARLPRELAAEDAITAVMCALMDRLTAGEAHYLIEAMPASMRPFFATCVRHRAGQPTMRIDHVEFLERVAEHLGVTPAHAELVCEVVFDAVRSELPDKLVDDVAHQLPRGLQQLWLAGPRIEPLPEEATLSSQDARLAIEEEIERSVALPAGIGSMEAFSAVMCALVARVSGGEARELAAGLPVTLRGLVERDAKDRAEEPEVFECDELLRRVATHLSLDPAEVEPIVRAVFGAVRRVLPEKATSDVASQLPVSLRELWEGEARPTRA
ncbi:MAG: DUF2267 domain-containing protein [Labilithrix sp.]|nr:DUF2267 domain-containing protein [Labilithrix sp.]MBX3223349.1 DUF2267 domain-containing protein [Labilithrix sp.]